MLLNLSKNWLKKLNCTKNSTSLKEPEQKTGQISNQTAAVLKGLNKSLTQPPTNSKSDKSNEQII